MNNKKFIDANYIKENKFNKINNQTIFFISIARYHPIKNHLLLLESFKIARNFSSKKSTSYDRRRCRP